jgi:glycosyltransferase involved in cell wall biosynthesis
MRVTIATRIYAPEAAAASFRLSALASALSDEQHEVTVLTARVPASLRDAARATDAADPGIRVRRAPVLRDASGQIRGYLQYLSFDAPLLLRLLFGRRPDAIVVEPPPTTGTVARLVATLRRTPYVYYAADVWSDGAQSIGAPRAVLSLLRRLEQFALGGAAHVIAVSPGVADRVRELGGHDRVTVVPNGVDTTTFTPEPASQEASRPPTAVYAGTMSEWQGADVFIRALPSVLASVPDARIVYLGQGSTRNDLEELGGRLGVADRVGFEGVVPPAEAAAALRDARVGLVSLKPGQGYDFAVPTKLFAAAACGTPVLFAGPGASVDVVRSSGIGTAVDYDVDVVARALVDALSSEPEPEDRRRIASWAQRNASIASTGRRAAGLVIAEAGERQR